MEDQISFYATFTPVPSTSLLSLEELQRNPTVTIALKIPNFTRMLNQAISSNDFGDIYSEPFYTSHKYRMKVHVSLNEGPSGFTGYMGVYLCLVPGEHDESLEWPFTKRVAFVVVDQQNDELYVNNYRTIMAPEGQEQFNRPVAESNEGYGFADFMLHSTARTRQYIKNGAVYIAVEVEH